MTSIEALVALTYQTGMTVALCGMFLRSMAMITAAQSFNHTVQSRKRADHTLVTHGVYR